MEPVHLRGCTEEGNRDTTGVREANHSVEGIESSIGNGLAETTAAVRIEGSRVWQKFDER